MKSIRLNWQQIGPETCGDLDGTTLAILRRHGKKLVLVCAGLRNEDDLRSAANAQELKLLAEQSLYLLNEKLTAEAQKDLTFQQRVIREREELDTKISRLRPFIGGEVFRGLEEEEQTRLEEQLECMENYSTILLERIENF